MAIQVEGYGNITKGNAKEIYVAWKRGEVELNKAQQTKCESFLSPEEIDEVQYDVKTSEKTGKDKINTEGTDNKGGAATAAVQTAGAAAALTGTIIGICKGMTKLTTSAKTNGFTSLACAIPAVAGAAVAFAMSFAFDPALKDRTSHSQNAANDNQTIDAYTEGLANSMEMMNEDVELYNEQQDELTTTVNTQVSQGADLQMQYDAAVAMGDTNGAQALKEQMKALSEQDNSQLEDELAETGEGIEEYRAMNAESIGVAGSGQSVSDFLKVGKGLGALAMINGGIDLVAAIYCGLAAAGIFPKALFDAPAAAVSKTVYGLAAGVFGAAGAAWMKKGKEELECGSAGSEMQEHVNSLNDMVGQQATYTDETEGAYAESDEAAAESQAEAQETAGEAVDSNKEGLTNKPKDEEEKPAPTGAAA